MQIFTQQAKGAFLGLAIGDALGTTLEFKAKDSYTPLTDMVGGGPFQLKAGEWTDDTSMALCLADSLLAFGEHNAADQMDRYIQWRDNGLNSVTGLCFDIGNTVNQALYQYQNTGNPNAGSRNPNSAGNGSLMRLIPVSLMFSPLKGASLSKLLDKVAASSITTHAAQTAVEGCQVMAYLLHTIFSQPDISKLALFDQLNKVNQLKEFKQISPEISNIVNGEWLTKSRDDIRGTGYVVQSLEAALWCFVNSDGFEKGALLAANLGDDADTTAAIYGQLAGAFYGIERLPQHWLDKLAWRSHIEQKAELLANTPI